MLGREIFSFRNQVGLGSLSPLTAVGYCVISQLLTDDRDAGRCRAVTGLVDRDDDIGIFATLVGV